MGEEKNVSDDRSLCTIMLILEIEIGGAGFDHGWQCSHIAHKSLQNFLSSKYALISSCFISAVTLGHCLLTVLQIIKITENESLPVANTLISAPVTP